MIQKRWYLFIWLLMTLEGMVALVDLLRIPSEAESAFLFGYSSGRLALAGGAVSGVVVFGVLTVASLRQPDWWQLVSRVVGRLVSSQVNLFGLITVLYTLFISIFAFQVLSFSIAADELVILKTILARAGLLLVWAQLITLELLAILYIHTVAEGRRLHFGPISLSVLLAATTIVYVIALKIYTTATWDIRMRRLEEYIYLPAILFLGWSLMRHYFRDRAWYARLSRILFLASIGVLAYTIYRHTAQWMEWQVTPSKAYWHLVADAFLHGRLYLENPAATHDMTFYEGHWYVPNPPLPALMMLPFVAVRGVENINSVLFSIGWGALCVILIYLILEQASRLEMIPTRRQGNIWLTGLFAVGTTFWWLSIMGRVWFTSQIFTVFFTGLAILFALKRMSP